MLFSRQIENKAEIDTSTTWKTMTGFGEEEGEQGSPNDRESKFFSTLGEDLPDRPEGAPTKLVEGMLAFYAVDGRLKHRLSNIFREGNHFVESTGLRNFSEFKDVYNLWIEKIEEKEEQGLLPSNAAEALRKNLTFMAYDKEIKQQLEEIALTPEKLKLVFSREDQQRNILREMKEVCLPNAQCTVPNAADPRFLWAISEERAPPHILDARDPFQGVQSRLIERVDHLLGNEDGNNFEYMLKKDRILHNIDELKKVVDQVTENPQEEVQADYIGHIEKEALLVEASNVPRLATFTESLWSVPAFFVSQASSIVSTLSSDIAHVKGEILVETLKNVGDMLGISGTRELQIPIECTQASIGQEAWNAPEVQRGCKIIANQRDELFELKNYIMKVEVEQPLNVLTGASFAGYVVGNIYDYTPDIDNRYIPKKDWVILDNFQFNKDGSLIEEFKRNFEVTDDFNMQYAKQLLL